MSSVACFVGFASCKTFGKQPKRPCFGAKPPYRSSAICATASCSGFVRLTASILAWSRGGSPSNIAPARMPGVYAARLCRTQSQPSIHSPLPWGRGLGLGIENKHFFGKTDFFYKLIRLHTQADLFISYIDTNELVMYNQIRNKKEEKIC